MVAKAGGCYGAAFKGARGVTQGYALSPTIFIMMVDEVVWHWVTVMVKSKKVRGTRGQQGRHQNSLFYMDDGMVALSDPHWLQGGFRTCSACLSGRS